MGQRRICQVAVAIASLAVAVALLALGRALVPDHAVAAQRDVVAQWLFTWGLIWITALAAAVLSVFLFSVGPARSHLSG